MLRAYLAAILQKVKLGEVNILAQAHSVAALATEHSQPTHHQHQKGVRGTVTVEQTNSALVMQKDRLVVALVFQGE